MIILHAGIIDGRIHIWGEVRRESGDRSTARSGRPGRLPRPLPFGALVDELFATFETIPSLPAIPANRFQKALAWLPTQESKPLPSSPLITGMPPKDGEQTSICPWVIHTLPLFPHEAVCFLGGCAGKQTLAPGVVLAADLGFCVDALRYAGGLVARQQYLPGLIRVGARWRACWEPVITGTETGILAALVNRMPASARALTELGVATPKETSARESLDGFLSTTVDCLIRSANTPPSDIPPSDTRPRRQAKHKVNGSLHESWLQALCDTDGDLQVGAGTQWGRLATQIVDWRRPVTTASVSPVRLCFRLEEPGGDGDANHGKDSPGEGDWTVRYLLQPHDDPSLIVPIAEVWKKPKRGVSQLKRYGPGVYEYLLSSLGQAAGLSPAIAVSLKSAQPEGYSVDANGAHEFLLESAMALEQAGFGVMLPAWWTRKGTKIHLVARAKVRSPKMKAGSGLSLDEITRFDWEVALDGKKLTLKELEVLAQAKSSLVKIRGQWVEMRAGEIRSAIEFWKQKNSGEATVRDILRMAMGAVPVKGGIEFEGVRASGWIGELLKQLEGKTQFEELDTPEAFSGTLRSYQVRGYSWLAFLGKWGLGACLADDMGLGKTVQTLAQIQRDWDGGLTRPVLLVCPTTVVNNWVKEAARFTPNLSIMVHHGVERTKGKEFIKAAQQHTMVISSYALLHRDAEFLQPVSWAGVILDEAQNIKNSETKQARAARSLKSDYRIALTGTPVENNVGDLWSIMEFLNPGFLGTQAEFKRSFFIPIQTGQDPSAAIQLKQITKPFILRRLKTDKTIIADLPEKQEMNVFCSLTQEQASLYAAVLKEVDRELDESEGIQRKGLILATLSKLKQVCNHPVQFLGDNSSIADRSGKLTRLVEILEEILEAGERALVFTQFAEMGGILQRHLEESFGREVLFLHGGVAKKRRDGMVEQFQGEDGPSIFILSLKAGGTGLNLVRANHVIHFDRWWNPAVENQATDRAFRIGQIRNVQVRKFVCAGTLEEKINEMIERKKEIAENVVGTGEGWLTELSNTELRDLFTLRSGAVQE